MFRLAAPQLAQAAEDLSDARSQLAKAMNDTGLAAALVATGSPKEAFPLFEDAVRALDALLQRDADNLFTRYTLGLAEVYRGAMYEQLARETSNRDARLDHWRKAEDSVDRGVTRMGKVNEHIPLTSAEQAEMNFGIEVLARVKANIGTTNHQSR